MPEPLDYPIRSDKLRMQVKVDRTLCDHQSAFQRIEIVETEVLGKVLLLDRHVQLSTFDERAYHEFLVHPASMNLPKRKRALIVGGGDGGTLRELVRCPDWERIEMVEIDRAVLDLSLQHLPEMAVAAALEDPRVDLVIGDAFPYVREGEEGAYDLIVMDSTDVYEDEEGELSEALFTRPFFEDCRRLLAPGGVIVTQADNPVFCPYSLEALQKEWSEVFEGLEAYFAAVPSFGGFSAFCLGRVGSGAFGWNPEYVRQLTGNLGYLTEAAWAYGRSHVPWGA